MCGSPGEVGRLGRAVPNKASCCRNIVFAKHRSPRKGEKFWTIAIEICADCIDDGLKRAPTQQSDNNEGEFSREKFKAATGDGPRNEEKFFMRSFADRADRSRANFKSQIFRSVHAGGAGIISKREFPREASPVGHTASLGWRLARPSPPPRSFIQRYPLACSFPVRRVGRRALRFRAVRSPSAFVRSSRSCRVQRLAPTSSSRVPLELNRRDGGGEGETSRRRTSTTYGRRIGTACVRSRSRLA